MEYVGELHGEFARIFWSLRFTLSEYQYTYWWAQISLCKQDVMVY